MLILNIILINIETSHEVGEIVAVQKLSTLQAYGRSVLGYIEVDLLSTQEKNQSQAALRAVAAKCRQTSSF